MLPLRDQLPARRTPVVTWLLIAVNVAAFLWELAMVNYGGSRVLFEWGLVPRRFAANPLGELGHVFTSMFMHSPETLMHLGGNMLFLWIFGDNVEDALGRGRFLFFYLACGVVAALAQVAISPYSAMPMIGASGAIAGVLAAYGALYPRSPILVLNPIVPLWFLGWVTFTLPAWLIILEFFVMNLLNGFASFGSQQGGVAFFAHLGGFVAGFVLLRLLVDTKGRRRERGERARTLPRHSSWYDRYSRDPDPWRRPGPRRPW